MEEISRTPKTTPTSKRGTTPRTPRSGNKQSLLVTPNKVSYICVKCIIKAHLFFTQKMSLHLY